MGRLQGDVWGFMVLNFFVAIGVGPRHLLLPVSGRSVAWLARLFRVQEVVSSNLTAPTIFSTRAKPKSSQF